jgi:chromosome segregation ATPase
VFKKQEKVNMSDDLVKQLRFTADDVCRCGTSVCLEAADRIEHLEDRCANLLVENGILNNRIEKLEAALQRANATAEEYERKFYLGSDRIEQLESALREIINKDSFSMDWAIRTARKALEGKDD